jgi:hypothetical protein
MGKRRTGRNAKRKQERRGRRDVPDPCAVVHAFSSFRDATFILFHSPEKYEPNQQSPRNAGSVGGRLRAISSV